MPRTRPPYPEEFRREVIRLAQLGDKPQRRLAKDLGISDVTLRNWLKEEKAAKGERPGGLSGEEREELARLRAQLMPVAGRVDQGLLIGFPARGESEVRGAARAETRFHFHTAITSVVPWLVVSGNSSQRRRRPPRNRGCFIENGRAGSIGDVAASPGGADARAGRARALPTRPKRNKVVALLLSPD